MGYLGLTIMTLQMLIAVCIYCILLTSQYSQFQVFDDVVFG